MMLYLASQSPRRRQILTELKIPFRVVKSRYQEKRIHGLSFSALALRHSLGKALGVKLNQKKGCVLAADTLVYRADKIYGKPRTLREARQMLGSLQGRSHGVVTAVVLRSFKTGKVLKGICRTRVWIKKLTQEQIEEYFRKVNPLDKAGAYGIQEGPRIVTQIKGSYTNVVGLPVELLKKMLKSVILRRSRRI